MPAPPARFGRIEIAIVRWRVLAPWSFEFFGGICLGIACLRRRPDLILARHDLYTVAPALIARLLRIPLVSHISSSIPEELTFGGRPAAQRIATICERFHLRCARVVAVLEEAHGRSVAARTGIDPRRCHAVGVGARLPSRSDPVGTRDEFGISPETFLVGFAGNLSPIQGVDRLLEACMRLRDLDLQLWIIGTGTEQRRLLQIADPISERVRFFGGVLREEADRLLAACQLLVAPYRKREYERISAGGALSSKVMTYLAIDRPILITDLPGYRWVEAIGAGESVDTSDPERLAGGIRASVVRWRDAGSPLVDWPWSAPGPGRRFVEEGGTWQHVAERLEPLLRSAASSARRPGR
jgi:glycosyltransferase involved in cell wall biosynthesis